MKRLKQSLSTPHFLFMILMCTFILFSALLSVKVIATEQDVFDLTEYDAESKILGFIPYADSGLSTIAINPIPRKELMVSYDGTINPYDSSARVNFKIGEWRFLGGNNESREEFIVDDDTILIKSEFWFETDVISWTDLEYEDVFWDGVSPVEIQKQCQWLYLKTRHNYGWNPFTLNGIGRISAWNDDLYQVYSEVGDYPTTHQLVKWVNQLFEFHKPYYYSEGLQHLLKNPINYMPEHYNKYLRWNQLNFPGNPTNMHDYTLRKFNDLKINGDLYFDVNLKESFWNLLDFPEVVEVVNQSTGVPIGVYNQSRIVFSIADGYTIAQGDPNHPNSRTKIVDLQELYDNSSIEGYDSNSANGNFISSTEDNQPLNASDDVTKTLDSLKDPDALNSMIPSDALGDGSAILGIIDRTAKYSWDKNEITLGPNAVLPGTNAIEPLIWNGDIAPEIITETELYNLKPLDAITLQDFKFGYDLKDRSSAILKTRFEFGPKLIINFATLNLQQIHLTMENGFYGGFNDYWSVTDVSDLTHIPYSANVRNIGMCQTIKLKVITLSTYDYQPILEPSDEDVTPDFPFDDTGIDWPDEPVTGGDVNYTRWTDMHDPIDAFLGTIIDFIQSNFWIFLILIIAFIAVALFVVIKVFKTFIGGPSARTVKNLERMNELRMTIGNKINNGDTSMGGVHHVQGVPLSRTVKVFLSTLMGLCVAFGLTLYVLLI